MSNKSTIIPSYYCCISQCRNYKNPHANIDLYPLPDDLLRREKCCEILGIPMDVGMNVTTRVCALHFKSKVGSYKPATPQTVSGGVVSQPLALFVDDGRRLNFRPILPRMQTTTFPTPLQQPPSFQLPSALQLPPFQPTPIMQQPITVTFNPGLIPKAQQSVPVKEPSNDNNNKSIDNDSVKKDNLCSSSDVTLQLECEEDSLSSSQVNTYMKDYMDYFNASELVHRLPAPERSPSNYSDIEGFPSKESILQSAAMINSPVTLSSSIPNTQFVHIVSPSTKGIGVVSNPISLLKNTVNSLPKVETTTMSSSPLSSQPLFSHSPVLSPRTIVSASSSLPLFAHSPVLAPRTTMSASSPLPLFTHSPVFTPRTVNSIVSDKNPAFMSMNGKQFGSSSFGANLSSNGLVSQYGQIPNVGTLKLNSVIPASGFSSQPQTVTSTSLPICSSGSILYDLAMLTNSSPISTLPINPSGNQAKPVYQIMPEKYKIVNAVSSTNAAIPVMLLKAIESSDGGQSFKKNTTSASNSPLTILGREPDETETCAASLCDVTLSESTDQILLSLERPSSSNDLSTVLNQTSGSSPDKLSVGIEVESPVNADEKQFSSSNTDGQIGPVIVDVISAKEGATEFYNADTIPNILFDKSKKAENSNDASLSSQVDTSSKPHLEKLLYQTVEKMYSVTEDSIFSLQKSIPVISNGHQMLIEPLHMFNIKIPVPSKRNEEAENLRKRLRQENFIPWAVWWLIQRRYMPVANPCNFCGSQKFIVDKNDNFPDGYCWTCANSDCPVQKPIKRPTFFERFKLYSIQDLLLLTYHWACQSSFEEITQDVDIDCEKIWYYFKALQELCHQVAVRKGKLGLAQTSLVEVSAVKMGYVFILGAMDRKTRYVRLEAINESEAYQSARHISILDKWVNKHGTIVTENMLPETYLPNIRKVAADPSVLDPLSSLPHTLNISKYLSKNLTSIFGSITQHTLKTNDIQGFLYELQWRVKYGKFVDMAFWSILNHIRDLNVEEGSLVQVKKGAFTCEFASTKVNNALSVRWGITLEDNEKNSASQNQIPKLSGKDTKSYSKDTSPSFSDYFHDVPEIQGGSAMVTSKALLAVKIRFGESPADIDFYKSDAICLGLKLKSEGFITNPIKWLVKKGFVKNISTCYVCQGVAFLKESSRFSDGCSWACQNEKCKFENVFKRPSFFARYPQYPMSHVAGMIFHWIVQSDESLINTDVPMDASKILDAWRSFQGLCSSSIKRKKGKIGGDQHIVEVAMVKFGKLYILGAMDRVTKRSLLQAFPAIMGKSDSLYYTLLSWILPKSTIVINANKNFKMHQCNEEYSVILANTNISDKNDPSCHVLNIESYLIKYISNMFCHIKADFMRQEIMQSYLEELMWREKYGKEPQQAFVYIMNEIFYNDLRYKSDYSRGTKDPKFIPVKFKELRVVLRKIPKSVLKFYGCELPGSSKTSEGPNSTFSEITEKQSSDFELDDADDTVPDTVQYSSQRLVESDDDVIIIDTDVPSSDIPESKVITLEETPASEPPDASESTSSSITSESSTNKVQPLVIKMHKKRKKFKSYLKSELEKVKKMELEKGLNNSVSYIPNTALRIDLDKPKYTIETPDSVSSDSSHSTSWETQSTDSVESAKKVAQKHSTAHSSSLQKEEQPMSVASDSSHSNTWETQSTDSTNSHKKIVVKKRLAAHSSSVPKEDRPLCIECGERVGASFDHFMKQFNCTDCKKKSIYTTCCSKSFFEHRGAVLFGKRMPRRRKEDYGLHRPIIMPSPWHCACGFNTKNGNKLASHMVKCRKRTCYYHQNVL